MTTLANSWGWPAWVVLALGLAACAPEDGDALAVVAPAVGEVAQELSNLEPQTIYSGQLPANIDPSLAWIRSGVGLSLGQMLAAFTSDDKAAYAISESELWNGSTPFAVAYTWQSGLWPAPDNFCNFYDCNVASWDTYRASAQALWTGNKGVAAIIALGGTSLYPYDNLTILTSTDDGSSFTYSTIINTTTESAFDIDPETVHASLAYTRERGTALDGTFPAWIYVTWRTLDGVWFASKLLVDPQGKVVQPQAPKVLAVLSKESHGKVAIVGWEDDNGDELVELAFSQPTNGDGIDVALPSCPSQQTVNMAWWLTYTRNFDHPNPTWKCPENVGNCVASTTRIALDKTWKACVGGSAVAQGSVYNRNNDRPAYALNQGAPWRWLYAVSHSDPGSGKMGVRVYQDNLIGSGLWSLIYAPPILPDADQHSPQLVVHQGTLSQHPVVAVTWKTAYKDNTVEMFSATSPEVGDAGSWLYGGVTSAGSWDLTINGGIKHGLAVLQLCVDDVYGICPGQPASVPQMPFLAAWPTTAQETNSVISTRKFEH